MSLTTHELLQVNELLRMESMEVKKLQAMAPMIADADLQAEIATCIQTGTNHVKALVALYEANQKA